LEYALHHIAPGGDAALAFGQAKERASVALGDFPGDEAAADFAFELEQAEGVRHGRAVLADAAGNFLLGHAVFLDEAAVFSIYRRASEMPLYRVEKRPKLRARQGQYAVIAAGGQVLKRGHELSTVLRVLERKLVKAIQAAE